MKTLDAILAELPPERQLKIAENARKLVEETCPHLTDAERIEVTTKIIRSIAPALRS